MPSNLSERLSDQLNYHLRNLNYFDSFSVILNIVRFRKRFYSNQPSGNLGESLRDLQ